MVVAVSELLWWWLVSRCCGGGGRVIVEVVGESLRWWLLETFNINSILLTTNFALVNRHLNAWHIASIGTNKYFTTEFR